MGELRQSILRARMAKPLPGGAQAARPRDTRTPDMAAIDARFSVLDKKLDTLIGILKGASESDGVSSCCLLPSDIRRAVTQFFKVTDHELDCGGRSAGIVRIRQIAFYLCRTRTTRSLPEIGRAFRRDHSTILHGVKRINALRATDAALDEDLTKLEARLADIVVRRVAA